MHATCRSMPCWTPRRHASRASTGRRTACHGSTSTSRRRARARTAAPSMPSSRCAPPSSQRLTPSSSWHARPSPRPRQASTRVANAWQAHGGCSHAQRKSTTLGQLLSGTLARSHASDPVVSEHLSRCLWPACTACHVPRKQHCRGYHFSLIPTVLADMLHIDLLVYLLLARIARSSSSNHPLHTTPSFDHLIS